MSEASSPSVDPGGMPPKEPPPLDARAVRPRAVRLRKSMVQTLVLAGAGLLSGSLVWAFFIQPGLRDGARNRAAEAAMESSAGLVRPSEAVTDQPASYDRLPEPRVGGDAAREGAETTTDSTATARPVYRSSAPYRSAQAAGGAAPRTLAVRSALFFEPDRRGGRASGVGPETDRGQARVAERTRSNADLAAVYNVHQLTPPVSPFELKAGAMVPAVLLTAVDTARSGPVIATVTQNVYDTVSGRYLLLPQGTRLIGKAGGESAYGDRRAFLVWERLILPNGKSLILGGEAGVDAQGAVGVRGQVDRRILPLLVGTLFAGAITTLGQAARDGEAGGSSGFFGDAGDAAAIEASRIGGKLVDRELQVRPSIRLEAGAPVRVMITRDLILERYAS